MKSYTKNCDYCHNEITMSDESGKWLPYNKDKSSHDCKTNGQKQKQEPKQEKEQQQERPIPIKQLKIWIARLEKNGIHIDINEILKPKQDESK